jgi:hypothetical protein
MEYRVPNKVNMFFQNDNNTQIKIQIIFDNIDVSEHTLDITDQNMVRELLTYLETLKNCTGLNTSISFLTSCLH